MGANLNLLIMNKILDALGVPDVEISGESKLSCFLPFPEDVGGENQLQALLDKRLEPVGLSGLATPDTTLTEVVALYRLHVKD